MGVRTLPPWEVEKWAIAEKQAQPSFFGFDNLDYNGFHGDDDGIFFGFNQAVESVRASIANTSASSNNGRDMFCKTKDAALFWPPLWFIAEISCGHSAIPDAYFAAKKNKEFLVPEDVAELQNILLGGCNRIQKDGRKNRCREWVGRAIAKLNEDVNEVMAGGGPSQDPSGSSGPGRPRLNYDPETGRMVDYGAGPNINPQQNGGAEKLPLLPIALVIGGIVLTYFIIKRSGG